MSAFNFFSKLCINAELPLGITTSLQQLRKTVVVIIVVIRLHRTLSFLLRFRCRLPRLSPSYLSFFSW